MTLKTQKTQASVAEFVAGIEDDQKRADAETLTTLMGELTGAQPAMWGPSMVGFGTYRYRYSTGREGEWFLLGFAARKQNMTVYLPGYVEQYQPILDRLGKHTTGRGCLYLKRLSDADPAVLRHLLETAVASAPPGGESREQDAG